MNLFEMNWIFYIFVINVKHKCITIMFATDAKTGELETRIIEAANKIFLKNGIYAATMGQIAEEASISRTSLNYYFRSKKRLLMHVINDIEEKIIPSVSHLINDEKLTATEKIELFVDEYLSMVIKYPMVPNFILSELSRDPDWIIQFFRQKGLNFEKFKIQIEDEISKGQLNSFKLEELFSNVLGLCLFPALSKPILMEFFFDHNESELVLFMDSRKDQVKKVLNSWLKPA